MSVTLSSSPSLYSLPFHADSSRVFHSTRFRNRHKFTNPFRLTRRQIGVAGIATGPTPTILCCSSAMPVEGSAASMSLSPLPQVSI